jgi:hypothetical protein
VSQHAEGIASYTDESHGVAQVRRTLSPERTDTAVLRSRAAAEGLFPEACVRIAIKKNHQVKL